MKKYLVLSLFLVTLFSCVLESKYALPEVQRIDKAMLGTWYDQESGKEALTITKLTKTRYTFTFSGDPKGKLPDMEAYIASVGDYQILNIVAKGDDGLVNMFYEYKIVAGDFLYRGVEGVDDKTFGSNAELVAYFEENNTKEGFFTDETEVLVRK